jgi:hypothetical protein
MFHLVCLRDWLDQSGTCPICRRPVHGEGSATANAQAGPGNNEVTLAPGLPGGGGGGGGAPAVGGEGGGEGQEGGVGGAASTGQVEILKIQYSCIFIPPVAILLTYTDTDTDTHNTHTHTYIENFLRLMLGAAST